MLDPAALLLNIWDCVSYTFIGVPGIVVEEVIISDTPFNATEADNWFHVVNVLILAPLLFRKSIPVAPSSAITSDVNAALKAVQASAEPERKEKTSKMETRSIE